MKAKTDSTKKKKKTDTGRHKVVFGLDVDRSSMLSLSALLLTQIKPRDISQHIAAWGWNSNQRCGHINAVTIPQPRQIQHSKVRNYIDCSAGRHHSLFLSEHGIVFSIGDGRKGQLGYGNLFSPRPKKGGVVQAIPQAITPTGNLKFGRDLQCMQVSAGGTFSMAREATPYEGARVVQGFLPLEQVLEEKLRRFPDSNSLREVWSYVRQERFMINKRADGLVITWGTGKHGELGLGDDIKFAPYPMVSLFYLFCYFLWFVDLLWWLCWIGELPFEACLHLENIRW